MSGENRDIDIALSRLLQEARFTYAGVGPSHILTQLPLATLRSAASSSNASRNAFGGI